MLNWRSKSLRRRKSPIAAPSLDAISRPVSSPPEASYVSRCTVDSGTTPSRLSSRRSCRLKNPQRPTIPLRTPNRPTIRRKKKTWPTFPLTTPNRPTIQLRFASRPTSRRKNSGSTKTRNILLKVLPAQLLTTNRRWRWTSKSRSTLTFRPRRKISNRKVLRHAFPRGWGRVTTVVSRAAISLERRGIDSLFKKMFEKIVSYF